MGDLRLRRDLATALRDSPEVQAAIERAGEAVLEAAKARAPVDTGALRDSLRLEVGPDGGRRVVVGTDHWAFVEYGTEDTAAEPFLRVAIDVVGLKRT